MNNNEIFQEFWDNYDWPPPKPIFFRLYHDGAGNPLLYTMEDLPGKYVEVTAEQYARANFSVRILDGKMQELEPEVNMRKLRPGSDGTPCHLGDVSIVVPENNAHQKWKKR